MAEDREGGAGRGSIRETGRAMLALLGAIWSVRRRPRGEGLAHGGASSAGSAPGGRGTDGVADDGDGPATAARVELARRAARSLNRACGLLPWRPSCLVRAVALKRMLRARGVAPAEVRVGVRREDGAFSAHAWVVLGDRIVGDSPENVAKFDPLIDLDVFPE